VGTAAAGVFDRLQTVQVDLMRGANGTGKHLSVDPSTLRHIAQRRPSTLSEMVQISGMTEAKIERFGAAFLDVLNSDGPEDTPLAPAKVQPIWVDTPY
jgi:ATP-dependent DNA helicase RecQ